MVSRLNEFVYDSYNLLHSRKLCHTLVVYIYTAVHRCAFSREPTMYAYETEFLLLIDGGVIAKFRFSSYLPYVTGSKGSAATTEWAQERTFSGMCSYVFQ